MVLDDKDAQSGTSKVGMYGTTDYIILMFHDYGQPQSTNLKLIGPFV